MNYRPEFHFAPKTGWMNDPNGLLYKDGQYHLFYQFYPHDTVWGPMHWGHAVSTDLVHWEDLPIALYPDEIGLAFSGSACLYQGKIALIYTSHGETEQQSLAFSEDGVHFTPYEGNPVIPNQTLPDFRDPKVFDDPTGHGYCLVLAAGDRAFFYHTEDLVHWEKTGEFGPFKAFKGCVWECPAITQIGEKWVLFTSVGKVKDKPLKDTYYWIGRWENGTFIAENEMEAVDFARDDYAGVTFYQAPQPTFLAWASQWVYAGRTPTADEGFRGQTTYARKQSLVPTDEGVKLAAEPLGPLQPTAELSADGPFEIRLSNDKEVFRTGVDSKGRVFMDRTGLRRGAWSRYYYYPRYSLCEADRYYHQKPCDFRFYFDGSVAEVYANGGTLVGTMLVYPKEPLTKLEIIKKEV